MNLNFDDLDLLVEKVVKELREELASAGTLERQLQSQTAGNIKDRGIKISPKQKNKESDGEVEEAEEEEIKVKVDKAGIDIEEEEYNKADVKWQRELPDVLKPQSIAKSLNVLRSGKSLKDKEVFARFQQYWDGLSAAEKVALKGFMDGLVQVIVGDVSGSEAQDPSEAPYNVEMSADPKQETPEEPAITRRAVPTRDDRPAGEDVPIVVGESANKDAVLRIMRKLR